MLYLIFPIKAKRAGQIQSTSVAAMSLTGPQAPSSDEALSDLAL